MVNEEQAKLVGDNRVVPKEWRRASMTPGMVGEGGGNEAEVGSPPEEPVEWKNHQENIGKKRESFNGEDFVSDDQKKLVGDHSVVPKEWRRASMTPGMVGEGDNGFELKRKDSTPQEWRRASVQVAAQTEHDHRDRRPSHVFQREEEKVKKKIGFESVPDSWVGNILEEVRIVCGSQVKRELNWQ